MSSFRIELLCVTCDDGFGELSESGRRCEVGEPDVEAADALSRQGCEVLDELGGVAADQPAAQVAEPTGADSRDLVTVRVRAAEAAHLLDRHADLAHRRQ